MIQIPFTLGTSSARSKKTNNETLVNLFAETMPSNAKSPTVLMGTHGSTILQTLPTFPILGMHIFKKELYVVTPTKVYKLVTPTTYLEIGTVSFTSTKTISMANNGAMMVITQGDSYVYEPAGTTVFQQITDVDYMQSINVEWQDGYFIFSAEGSGQFFISSLYGIGIDPLDFATAEGSPDDIVGIKVSNRQLWIFGVNSIEVWFNTGAADFPFQRIQGSFIQKGCINKDTIKQVNSILFFVGNDGIVYLANGYKPQRVSNESVEYKISKAVETSLRSFEIIDEGHFFYCIVINNETMCYDLKTGLWHTRKSSNGRWRIDNVRSVYSKIIGCDFENGNIYELNKEIGTEDGKNVTREAITTPISNKQEFFTLSAMQLDMETGNSEADTDDEVKLNFSKDGGVTWSFDKVSTIGKQGNFLHRVIWRRLGRHREISVKISTNTKSQLRLISLYIEIQ